MRNTLKHLTLLTRMKDDGLLPALTGSFSEDAIAQACGQVETLQLQERLHIRKTKRIQEELIRVPNFAALYGVLCRQEIGDEEIASVLESADGYGEKLTAYPQEQVLAVMKLELLPSFHQFFQQACGTLCIAFPSFGNGGGMVFGKIPLYILQYLVIGQLLIGGRCEEYIIQITHRHPPHIHTPHLPLTAQPVPSAPEFPVPCSVKQCIWGCSR